MSHRHYLTLAVLALSLGIFSLQSHPPAPALAPPNPAGTEAFLVKPYLQLGNPPPHKPLAELTLLWQTTDAAADWSVEYQTAPESRLRTVQPVNFTLVALPGVETHRIYRARLDLADAGGPFSYRVIRDGKQVFESRARAPRGWRSPHRFVVFGDAATNSPAQKAIAAQIFETSPDLIMITGDIVYPRGLISEYSKNFWPIYNAELVDPCAGAPLLRTVPFAAAIGNHDVAGRDLSRTADGLAYYLYWDLPRNGPTGEQAAWNTPLLGPASSIKAFLQAAAGAYPNTANYSFDYANVHWTVLDSNSYVDWTSPELRAWLKADLAAAQGSDWRFVAFHHPGFNSSKAHFEDQQMRLLAELFEEGKVDLVFAGHVHNYQRTYPLRFRVQRDRQGKPVTKGRMIDGDFTLDREFDGQAKTQPRGVIYLVTGAGGNHLYNPEQDHAPATWQPFTLKLISRQYSFTQVDVQGGSVDVRQQDPDGNEIDRFRILKSS